MTPEERIARRVDQFSDDSHAAKPVEVKPVEVKPDDVEDWLWPTSGDDWE